MGSIDRLSLGFALCAFRLHSRLRGGGELRESHLLAGDLAGGGVHEEPLHEDFRRGVVWSSVAGVILGLEVVLIADRVLRGADADGLGVGAGDAVGLGSAGHDDELQVCHVLRGLGVEGEGERVCGEGDGGSRGGLHPAERGRGRQGIASAIDYPVVEPHVEVAAGDLGGGAEDGAAGLGEGEAVPCEDLLVGEGLPALGELLEYGLDGGLRCGARASAVASVADVLAPHGLGGGDPLGGAGHLLECDGRNVLHSL